MVNLIPLAAPVTTITFPAHWVIAIQASWSRIFLTFRFSVGILSF
jgi:hypothetical protein